MGRCHGDVLGGGTCATPCGIKAVWSPAPSPRAYGLSLGAARGCPWIILKLYPGWPHDVRKGPPRCAQTVPGVSPCWPQAVPRLFLRRTHGDPKMPLRCLRAVPEPYTGCPQAVPRVSPGCPRDSPGPALSCPRGAAGLRMGAPSQSHLSSGLPPALTLCLCCSDGAHLTAMILIQYL